jgi:hypothetical protein
MLSFLSESYNHCDRWIFWLVGWFCDHKIIQVFDWFCSDSEVALVREVIDVGACSEIRARC